MRTILVLLMFIASPGIIFANPAEYTVKESMVPLGHGIGGEEIYVRSLKISPDFQHIGYVSRIGGTFRVWFDGVSKKSYSGITRQSPFFSPKQNRLAYIASEDDKMFVVIDDQEQKPYKQVGSLTFSPDGNRLAYRAEDDKGRQYIVVDGKEGPKFEKGITNDIGVVFSPDSQHLAYVGLTENNSCIFVKDNKKMRSFDKIGQVEFSPDSRHLAYTAFENGNWTVVLDDDPGAEYKTLSELVFSPDSKQLAYMAEKKRRPIIVINEEEISAGSGVFFPSFSPKESRFAYLLTEKSGKFGYVIEGKQELLVDKPGRLIFSHDDTSVAYAAMIKDKWHVIKDGVAGPGFKKIYAFSYSPASNDILYAAENDEGKTTVVFNDVPGKWYDSIGIPVFSADGKKYGYVAKKNEDAMVMVIMNEEASTTYPLIGILTIEAGNKGDITEQQPFFSPNGDHIAYPVYDLKKKAAFMVVDGKPLPSIGGLLTKPIFSHDGNHIAYMAKKGEKWHMVVDGQVSSQSCDGIIRGATIAFDASRNCFFVLVASETETGLSFFRMEAKI